MTTIDQQFFRDVLSWFGVYTRSFFSSDEYCQENIILKRKHSIRVASLSGLIAQRLGLPEEQILLAKLIGLLHDIARFEQFTRYRTFRDQLSFDHGEYGVELLGRMEILKGIDNTTLNTIRSAIFYHNKIEVPSTLGAGELLQAQLIRDADKLDIFYLTGRDIRRGENHTVPAELEKNGKLTPEVIAALAQRKPISYESVRTQSDFLLLKIGWVYDLNFVASMAILQKRNLLANFKSALPASNDVEAFLSQIDTYLQEKLADE